jgi:hypothetical protein
MRVCVYIYTYIYTLVCWGCCLFSIMTGYGMDFRGSIPTEAKDFFYLLRPTAFGAHQPSSVVSTVGYFPAGNMRPGRAADYSHPSSS